MVRHLDAVDGLVVVEHVEGYAALIGVRQRFDEVGLLVHEDRHGQLLIRVRDVHRRVVGAVLVELLIVERPHDRALVLVTKEHELGIGPLLLAEGVELLRIDVGHALRRLLPAALPARRVRDRDVLPGRQVEAEIDAHAIGQREPALHVHVHRLRLAVLAHARDRPARREVHRLERAQLRLAALRRERVVDDFFAAA